MLPASWAVLTLLTAILGVSLTFLVRSCLDGQFDAMDDMQRVLLEADDRRDERARECSVTLGKRVLDARHVHRPPAS